LERFAIITGGGRGVRMNEAVPKQFLPLGEMPIIMRTMQPFQTFCKKIIVSLPKDYHDFWIDLQKKYAFSIPHTLAAGGETRFESVKNALEYLPAEGWVAVHDAVRPFVSENLIEKCFCEAEKYGNAVAALPMTESLRRKNKSVDRSLFFRVQTPQVFRCGELKAAYQQPYRPIFTDDATVLEAQGGCIHLVEGEERNIKITTPMDMLFCLNWDFFKKREY
jgi:2-C-methyl-D-erythritol 4-phosphate cytidylyltransferase